MLKRIAKFINAPSFSFEKNSILLFSISMGSSLLNYIFQIIIGNRLSVAEYGEYNTLSSLTMIIGLTSGALSLLVSKYAAIFSARNEPKKIGILSVKLLYVCAGLGLTTFIVGIILSPFLADIFSLPVGSIIFMFFITGAGLLVSVTGGVLQGTQKFLQFGMASFFSTVGKVVFGIILVYLGFSVFGLLAAGLIGSAFAFIYGYGCIRKYIVLRGGERTLPEITRNAVTAFLTLSFLLQCCTTITGNIDLLFVKYYFTADEAGLYSSAMLFGRISMYVTNAIVAVVFPVAVTRVAEGKKTKNTFIKSLLYGGVVALLCAIFLLIFAKPVISLFFGERYVGADALVLPVSAFVLPLTLITILTNYELAVGKGKFLCISFIIGLAGMVVGAILFHSSIPEMIFTMSAVFMLVTIVNIIRISVRESRAEAGQLDGGGAPT